MELNSTQNSNTKSLHLSSVKFWQQTNERKSSSKVNEELSFIKKKKNKELMKDILSLNFVTNAWLIIKLWNNNGLMTSLP